MDRPARSLLPRRRMRWQQAQEGWQRGLSLNLLSVAVIGAAVKRKAHKGKRFAGLIRRGKTPSVVCMVAFVALNNRIIPAEEAVLPALAEGARYGSGCFETMALRGGQPRFWQRHMERFIRSCVRLGFAPATPVAELLGVAEALVARSGLHDGVLRLSAHQRGASADTLLTLSASPYAARPQSWRLGVSDVTHPGFGPLAGIKHNNYGLYLAAHARARELGFDEAVLADAGGRLLEGSRTNLYLVTPVAEPLRCAKEAQQAAPAQQAGQGNWRLQTAPLSTGVLPGVMRSLVLEHAGAAGFAVSENAFDAQDAATGVCCFVSNALLGVLPVSELGGQPFDLAHPAAQAVRQLHERIAKLEQ